MQHWVDLVRQKPNQSNYLTRSLFYSPAQWKLNRPMQWLGWFIGLRAGQAISLSLVWWFLWNLTRLNEKVYMSFKLWIESYKCKENESNRLGWFGSLHQIGGLRVKLHLYILLMMHVYIHHILTIEPFWKMEPRLQTRSGGLSKSRKCC